MKHTLLSILTFFTNCNSHSEFRTFTSEFGYSIILPENWVEYGDDENVNAFFDKTNWTGNLRVTVIEVNKTIDKIDIEDAFNSHQKAEIISVKNGLTGFKYTEKSHDGLMHYWQLYHKNKLFVFSFILNPKNKLDLDKTEIEKVEKIVNSIKVL